MSKILGLTEENAVAVNGFNPRVIHHKFVTYDHPGESMSWEGLSVMTLTEVSSGLWWWLLLRMLKLQSMSTQTVLLRTTLTQTIILHRLVKMLVFTLATLVNILLNTNRFLVNNHNYITNKIWRTKPFSFSTNLIILERSDKVFKWNCTLRV